MSLVIVAWRRHPDYPLIVCANREEFHTRAVNAACWLDHAPDVLAGYDPDCDDCWLGVSRSGRFSALTCYRNPKAMRPGKLSRGGIVGETLAAETTTLESLRTVRGRGERYNPFSLLVFDGRTLGWCSNRIKGVRELESGIYGLSNHLLDTSWPKVRGAKDALASLLADSRVTTRDLFEILDDRERAPDHMLPNTGIGRPLEAWLSPRFVVGETYGTRRSTVVKFRAEGGFEYVERSFDRLGVATGTLVHDFATGGAQPGPVLGDVRVAGEAA